jgi:hypothetical protein
VNEAYKRVVNSDVRYRFVIDMKSLDRKDWLASDPWMTSNRPFEDAVHLAWSVKCLQDKQWYI